GLDPQFSQIFSRSTSSGKFLEVNRNLVNALQVHGLWERVREDILRSQGDIQGISAIPDDIKATFKTSFQLSPYAFLEVAARAQKWIDQAISRNMYLETRDVDEMIDIYSSAWKKGVKTTYYLHMKPRHTAEQSTVKVNKAEEINADTSSAAKKGFGSAVSAGASADTGASASATPAGVAPRKGFGFGGAVKAGE
ncbi:MAG: ribonucleoside-diphosphate reductase subunit alpha, partial [Microbacterium sp.]|nr:ribonucleoside-diphosphate reductase subunit alpha [Microbacterium sp.]